MPPEKSLPGAEESPPRSLTIPPDGLSLARGGPETPVLVSPAGPGPQNAAQRRGEFARVQIMGHDERTGWITDGTLAGAACLDVRDTSGRLIAKIPPHSVYLYEPVLPPDALRALPAGPGGNPEQPWDEAEPPF